MDLNTVKALFDSTISESKWWQKFKGSEFATYLSTFVAQVAIRSEIAASRRLQESFLSLAVNDTSVLAGSESRGYVPMKRTPTRKAVTITNMTASARTLPQNAALLAEVNGLPYLINQSIHIPAGASVQAYCVQAERRVFSSTVTKSEKFMTLSLDPETSDRISSFDVYVTEFNDVRRKWEPSVLFRNTTKTSNAYVEFYTPTEQLGIRFGNGLLGRIPTVGAVIEIDCQLTEGLTDISAGSPLLITSEPALNSVFKIVTGETMAVGSGREDIESIRQNAMYYPSYDESLIWNNDHSFFIRRNIPALSWISVWGESEQELLKGSSDVSYINKIYIAAHHPALTQEQVKALIANLYAKVKDYNCTFVPTTTQYQPYTLIVTGNILSTNRPELAVEQLKAALFSYTASSAALPGAVAPNAIWSDILNSGILVSFSVQVVGVDLMSAPPIDTMRHLDLENSVFNVTY